MSIDHSNKPDGATHVVADIYGLSPAQKIANDRCCYRKKDGDSWLGFEGGQWYVINSPEVHRYQRIPAQWTGEGLPPVGTVCEYKDDAQWVSVEVKYLSGVTYVLRPLIPIGEFDEIVIHPIAAKFRPIRTPEQIKAEEKGRAVTEMLSIVMSADLKGRGVSAQLEALYEDGYRKQVTP